jgi:hypothetical protein
MSERLKDILFAVYVLIVVTLSILYFSVPERAQFMEYQLQWWKDLWSALQAITRV